MFDFQTVLTAKQKRQLIRRLYCYRPSPNLRAFEYIERQGGEVWNTLEGYELTILNWQELPLLMRENDEYLEPAIHALACIDLLIEEIEVYDLVGFAAAA